MTGPKAQLMPLQKWELFTASSGDLVTCNAVAFSLRARERAAGCDECWTCHSSLKKFDACQEAGQIGKAMAKKNTIDLVFSIQFNE